MSNEEFRPYLIRYESILKQLLAEIDIPAKQIKEAINYVLFPAGKRLRPLLVYLSGELFELDIQSLDIIAVAVELTHCYSLVHDDLPAMDNDDYRRGKLSCHRAFDEATAILVGDALQALSIECLLNLLPKYIQADKVILVAQGLLNATGPSGMVSGQSLDLSELTNPKLTETDLRYIQELKTGKLISACISSVLHIAEPNIEFSKALKLFALNLGIVFQIQDDYLDSYAASTYLGKNRASDSANKKLTFASLYSQKELAKLIANYYSEAEAALEIFGPKANKLSLLLSNLKNRG